MVSQHSIILLEGAEMRIGLACTVCSCPLLAAVYSMEQLCVLGPVGQEANCCRHLWFGACRGKDSAAGAVICTRVWSGQLPPGLDSSKSACESELYAGDMLLEVLCGQSTPGGIFPPEQAPQLVAEPGLDSPSVVWQHVRPASAAALLQSLVTRMKLGHS